MRQPPAERVRFILILKMLWLLLAFAGERLRGRVPFLPFGIALFHPLNRAGEIQIGKTPHAVACEVP